MITNVRLDHGYEVPVGVSDCGRGTDYTWECILGSRGAGEPESVVNLPESVSGCPSVNDTDKPKHWGG